MESNQHEKIVVKFERFDKRTERGLVQECRRRFGGEMELPVARKTLGFGVPDVDWNSLGTIAGVAISSIGVVLQVLSDRKRASAEKEWNAERLRKVFAGELLKNGVVNYRQIEIRGAKHFLDGRGHVCEFVVDGEDQRWTIGVHRSGLTFSIRADQSPPTQAQ